MIVLPSSTPIMLSNSSPSTISFASISATKSVQYTRYLSHLYSLSKILGMDKYLVRGTLVLLLKCTWSSLSKSSTVHKWDRSCFLSRSKVLIFVVTLLLPHLRRIIVRIFSKSLEKIGQPIIFRPAQYFRAYYGQGCFSLFWKRERVKFTVQLNHYIIVLTVTLIFTNTSHSWFCYWTQ